MKLSIDLTAYYQQQMNHMSCLDEDSCMKLEHDRQVAKEKEEYTKEVLEKYDSVFKGIAIGTTLLGVVLTSLALIRKKKVALHVVLTIIMMFFSFILLS